jgi:UDP-N-acetylmuramate--alanine ligase
MINIKLRIKNIYFIGIGGSGMSGIAEVLHNLGYDVAGSDIGESANIVRLSSLGIRIYNFHHQDNLKNADAVVVSSAIDKTNIELKTAKKLKIPIVPRAEMLAEIMRFRFGIAISGTHGKTTTTSLIAHILEVAKLDPTYIIGGILKAEGIGNRLGSGQFIVAEADESDKSFLHLNPMLSVITNIDPDHMMTYNFDYKKLQKAFIDFTSRLPFYGLCVACLDNLGVKQILPRIKRKVITYGFDENADIKADLVQYTSNGMSFNVIYAQNKININTKLIGKHNAQNILAAIAICLEIGVSPKILERAIGSFTGVNRRLDFKGIVKINNKNLHIYDDYAHHPVEINAVVSSVKEAKNKNPVVIFQPHRYSRTKELLPEFIEVLKQIDKLIILPIYPAGEVPIQNINSQNIINQIGKGCVVDNFAQAINILDEIAENNDIVLTLGAGDITKFASQIVEKYAT